MGTQQYLIDTNIFISLFNEQLAEPLPSGTLSCSIITEMELLSFPGLSQKEEGLLRNKFETLEIFGLTPNIKENAIQLRRNKGLALPDAIIGATAVTMDYTLLSNDSDFSNIPELSCQRMQTAGIKDL